jgi:hypothetical protein
LLPICRFRRLYVTEITGETSIGWRGIRIAEVKVKVKDQAKPSERRIGHKHGCSRSKDPCFAEQKDEEYRNHTSER